MEMRGDGARMVFYFFRQALRRIEHG